MIALVQKYKPLLLYIFFGICTTVVNLIIYHGCYNIYHLSNILSTSIAWLCAVLFAFITNKLFVFHSKALKGKMLVYEMMTFFGCRVITGIIEIGIMYVAVDVLYGNGLIMKVSVNILIIVINYIASKFVVFKRYNNTLEEEFNG